ncbi:hypothetical protein ACWCP6_05270 [Streptomyces sp. NPDC002004]
MSPHGELIRREDSGHSGESLKVDGLALITQGINGTLAELEELGMLGNANAGRGFSDLELSGLQMGHEGLQSVFDSFCERWEWGVRALVNEANAFAEGVGLSAGTFNETDQYVEGTLKVATNDIGGNPHLSEDQVTRMSPEELEKQTYLHPDYSRKSFEDAWEHSKQGWNDASRDVMTADRAGMQSITGMNDEQYDDFLKRGYGPTPEERAAAEAARAHGQAATQDGGAG